MLEGAKEGMKKVWGRKTFITLCCLVLGTLVDLFSKNGLSSNLMTLMGVLAGAYAVGNGAEHMAQKGTKTTSAQPQANHQEPQLKEIQASLSTVQNALTYIIKAAGLDAPQQSEDNGQAEGNQAQRNRQAVNGNPVS